MSSVRYPSFLGLPPEEADPERAGALVLPLPVDLTASWRRGTDAGPRAIIEASHHIEYYDEELDVELHRLLGGIATHPQIDLPCSPDAAMEAVLALACGLVREDRLLVSLGGEHSVTAPLVRAHRQLWPELCVVQIDAHADMRDEYMESIHNHACPMRRIMDMGVHVSTIGVRSLDVSERRYRDSTLSRIFLASEVAGNLVESTEAILDSLPASQVYLTVDLDGLDPSVIPAVGTPVPGGLGWYETLHFVRHLAEAKHIVGADVVELSPRESLHAADAAAARLVSKIIGYWGRSRAPGGDA
jgi:agmatinase